MKDFLQKIKSWAAKFFNKKISYKKSGINPTRDWGIILISTSVIMIILAVLSFYFYNQIKNGVLFAIQTKSKSDVVKIDVDLLGKTVEKINTKQSAFDSAQKNKTTVPDPSM